MATTTYEFKPKLGYADLETKTYTIPVFREDDFVPDTMIERTKEINRVLGGASSTIAEANTYAEAMRQTFLSSGGAELTRIISFQTVSTEEEVIYNG